MTAPPLHSPGTSKLLDSNTLTPLQSAAVEGRAFLWWKRQPILTVDGTSLLLCVSY